MTPDEVAAIVANPRLTNEAVRLILFVAVLGPGEHEIEGEGLRVVLGCASGTPVQSARKRAVAEGYLEVRQGGRGHANHYRYVCPKTQLSDLGVFQSEPKGAPIGGGDGGALTPVIPLPVLDVRAQEAIDRYGNLLVGCRGAIGDYLREVVPRERQAAWVDDIAGKINGLGFNWKGVPLIDRVGLVAAAVNELRASGEQGMKYKPGDPRNTRTKLGILGNDRVSGATGTYGGARSPPRKDRPSDTQDYKPTTHFPGFER